MLIPSIRNIVLFMPKKKSVGQKWILDEYSMNDLGASFALRKLNTKYTGSCIRIRRESDSTEKDIGFTGKDLDVSGLSNFIGGYGCSTVADFESKYPTFDSASSVNLVSNGNFATGNTGTGIADNFTFGASIISKSYSTDGQTVRLRNSEADFSNFSFFNSEVFENVAISARKYYIRVTAKNNEATTETLKVSRGYYTMNNQTFTAGEEKTYSFVAEASNAAVSTSRTKLVFGSTNNDKSFTLKEVTCIPIDSAYVTTWYDQTGDRTSSYNYSNLVSNGDFSNGLTGWNYVTANRSVNSNELTMTATAQYGFVTTALTLVNTRKYYVRALVKTTNNLVQLRLSDGVSSTSKAHSGSGNYEVLSLTRTSLANYTGNGLKIIDDKASGWSTNYVKEVMCIDLTALGLDNLTASQCDSLFPFTALGSNATLTKYNPYDWAQWVKSPSGVLGDNTGLEFTSDGSTSKYGYILSSFKVSTKYGLLYNVTSSNINSGLNIDLNGWVFDSNGNLAKTVGNQKHIATSKSSITVYNALYLAITSASTNGTKIKLKDIRVFELPTGSQIETDFTNLTADQLNTLYPMGYGESTATRIYQNHLTQSTAANQPRIVNAGILDRDFDTVKANTLYPTFDSVPSITNIVTNSTFPNTTGWTCGTGLLTTSSGKLITTGNVSSTFLVTSYTTTISTVVGRRYYIRFKATVKDTGCTAINFFIDGSINGTNLTLKDQINPTQNQEIIFEAIGTIGSDFTGVIMLKIVAAFPEINGKSFEITEPVIVDVTNLGQPCMYLNGTSACLINTANQASINITSQPLYLNSVFNVDSDIGSPTYIVCKNLENITNLQYALYYENTTSRSSMFLEGTSANASNTASNTIIRGNQTIQSALWNSDTMQNYNKGVASGTTDTYSGSLTSRANLTIGARSSNVGNTTQAAFFKGKISEIHIAKLTDQTKLIADQKKYYSIP